MNVTNVVLDINIKMEDEVFLKTVIKDIIGIIFRRTVDGTQDVRQMEKVLDFIEVSVNVADIDFDNLEVPSNFELVLV